MTRLLTASAALLALAGCSAPWAPRCDTRKVGIGMTREQMLAACSGPDQEYDYPPAGTHKTAGNPTDHAAPTAHWMGWHWWDEDSDVVRLDHDHVTWTSSNRALPKETKP